MNALKAMKEGKNDVSERTYHKDKKPKLKKAQDSYQDTINGTC